LPGDIYFKTGAEMKLENIIPPTSEQMARASGVSKKAAENWEIYCRACKNRFNLVKSILELEFNFKLSGKQVLDWGSAAGGVSILMDDVLHASITAADVDEHSLKWLKKTCDSIHCVTLIPGKALPFADHSFDAIIGISVLTHIPSNLQEFYLSELHRITKKDGVAIITILSESACEFNRRNDRNPNMHPHDEKQISRLGIIFSTYPETTLNSMDFSKNMAYGITYHSRHYVNEIFGKYFHIGSIEECGLPPQDVLVLRPK